MNLSKSYYSFLILTIVLAFVNRLIEGCLVNTLHEVEGNVFFFELIGFINDLGIICVAFLFVSPLFLLKVYQYFLNLFTFLFIVIYEMSHFMLIKFFLHDLTPLDVFLYSHTYKEIFFTLSTSNINFSLIALFLLIILVSLIYLFRYLNKLSYNFTLLTIITALSVIVILWICVKPQFDSNSFVINKTNYFIKKSIALLVVDKSNVVYSDADFKSIYPNKTFIDSNYIYLNNRDTVHSLDRFFEAFTDTPNVVVLVVEGLNHDFVNSYHNLELMPFLTSLKSKSLYWDKCFTLGERSFAVIPSITGGLPYGEKGFTFIKKYPKHTSLVSILEANDFQTNFFYGQGSWFHEKDKYFKYNNIDNIIDYEKYSDSYQKIMVGDYFWGYNDKDLFNNSFDFLNSEGKSKRLDIYFTGTSHSPYIFPNAKKYNDLLKELSNTKNIGFINKYERFLSSLIFVDESIEEFLEAYKSKPNYENTIFIITGDHPCTELPRVNSLKRYHVPLFIYSPKLKEAKTFNNMVSHLDVPESILSIMRPYIESKMKYSASLGSSLSDESRTFNKRFAFMDSNRDLIDFYSEGYFVSGDKLYWVGDNLDLLEVDDSDKFKKIKSELEIFNAANLLVCDNKLIPDSVYFDYLNYNSFSVAGESDVVVIDDNWSQIVPDLKIPKTDNYYMKLSLKDIKVVGEVEIIVIIKDNENKDIFWRSFKMTDYEHERDIDLSISLNNKETDGMIFKCLFHKIDDESRLEYSLGEFELLKQN